MGARTLREQVAPIDLIGGLISAAVDARRAGRGAALDVNVHGLTDLAESGGGSTILVDRVLADTVGDWIDVLWRSGWQPADIAHVVRRHHPGLPLPIVVDCMAARLPRYPASTVDERFRSQLLALDADAAGGDPVGFIARWARRGGVGPDAVVDAVIDLIAAVSSQHRLQRLCPPPGEARPRAGARRGAGIDPRVQRRVRDALARAESTERGAEADAFTARAQELVTRHGIDHALAIAAAGGPPTEEPGGVRIALENPYEGEKALLLREVAAANRCQAVWIRETGLVTVLGFPGDLRAVELLHTSLLTQATTAMLREGARGSDHGGLRTRGYRQAYLRAFAVHIGALLRGVSDARVRRGAAEDARLLPVLAARDVAVKRLAAELFPHMTAVASGTSYDGAGWALGAPEAELVAAPTLAADDEPPAHPGAVQDALFALPGLL